MKIDDARVISACNRLGWPGLRPLQQEVMEPILGGRNLVAVLPTSAGKSGIYQVPALAREGLVVVVSPLIALMIDQVDRLKNHGIEAASLNSLNTVQQKKETRIALSEGKLDLLYVSPERLEHMDPSIFNGHPVQMWAIDEAHCISEWGHDFRPSYTRLGRSLEKFNPSQIIALTATANARVIAEISQILKIQDCVFKTYSPDRPNITYMAVGRRVPLTAMVERTGFPCIVYGSTRKSVELAASDLQRAGFNAEFYHAKMNKKKRTEVQRKFIEGEIDVVSATCAFGMGIDHSRIRGVIHLEMPTSIESYTQEAGRAGRDGSQSLALCRSTFETLKKANDISLLSWPTPNTIEEIWKRITPLFEASGEDTGMRNRLHMTNEKIAKRIDFHPLTVGSALRFLQRGGNVRKTSYQEKLVRVKVNESIATSLRGKKEVAIVDSLFDHMNHLSVVSGSVSFFKEVVGLDKTYADRLAAKGALEIEWADRVQMLERLRTGVPRFDSQRALELRERAKKRIKSAAGFLSTGDCRRQYLLDYFGDFEGKSDQECCDRCVAKKRSSVA
jgi:RecQ family ATP-dependent DNA helicase